MVVKINWIIIYNGIFVEIILAKRNEISENKILHDFTNYKSESLKIII